jgi:hypothetical protein
VKVWDAHSCRVVADINCGANVFAARMPPSSTAGAAHCLVAVGSAAAEVALVDLRACSPAHRLAGHGAGGVLAVDWSPRCEWVLATGGADRAVRLWDVRRSGACFASLDEHGRAGDQARGAGVAFRGAPAEWAGGAGVAGARAHEGAVVGLRFSPSGRHLVSVAGGGARPLKVWSADAAVALPIHFSGASVQVRPLSSFCRARFPLCSFYRPFACSPVSLAWVTSALPSLSPVAVLFSLTGNAAPASWLRSRGPRPPKSRSTSAPLPRPAAAASPRKPSEGIWSRPRPCAFGPTAGARRANS